MATYSISATADDVTYSGTTLEPASVTFGYDGFNANHVGFRFLNFGPPQGATILSAVFTPQYNADGTGTSPGSWYGAKVPNLGAFSAGNNPPGIARTTATLASKAYNASDHAHDVTAIVQEVVNQATYAAGNAVGMLGISQTSGLRYVSYKDYSGGAGNAATLVVTWEVTLATLTLANTTTFANAHNGEVISAVGGKTAGSTLSITDPSGYFAVSGSNLTATGNIPAGTYDITITETLTGATNDGRETDFTITVSAAPAVRLVTTVTGVNTAVMPTHEVGDLIVVAAYRDGNTTAPTLPANWTSVRADTGLNTNSMRVAKRLVTTAGVATGTFTNATTTMLEVWRPGPGYTLDIGATAVASGSSTTISYPTFTLNVTDGSSWVLGFAGHRNLNVALETPPTGMVNRITIADGTDETAAHDTNGGVSSWGGATVAGGGSASGYYVTMVEMTVTGSGGGDYTLTADSAPFAITAQAAGLRTSRKLVAAGSSLAITAQPATLRVGRRLTAASAAFSIAASAANLRASRKLVAASAAYSISASDAALRRGISLSAASASFTITAQPATFRRDYRLSASVTAFTVSASPATLRTSRRLSAAPAAVAVTAQNANLRTARRLAAASASYSITPTAADLIYQPASASYVLAANSAAFQITASPATLRRDARLVAAPAALTITGQPATLRVARRIAAAGASYSINGADAALRIERRLTASPAVVSITTSPAGLVATRRLTAEPAAYVVTASDADLIKRAAIVFSPSETLTGPPVVRELTGSAPVRSLTGPPVIRDLTGSTQIRELTGRPQVRGL